MPHPNELSPYPKEGRRIAYAIIHSGDSPEVFVAQDEEVLQRVIALEVVAASDPVQLGISAERLRELLIAEEWGFAIQEWMAATGTVIDLYPDESIWLASNIPEDRIALELELGESRLFRNP